jgi:hypothetical protein
MLLHRTRRFYRRRYLPASNLSFVHTFRLVRPFGSYSRSAEIPVQYLMEFRGIRMWAPGRTIISAPLLLWLSFVDPNSLLDAVAPEADRRRPRHSSGGGPPPPLTQLRRPLWRHGSSRPTALCFHDQLLQICRRRCCLVRCPEEIHLCPVSAQD